MAVVDSLAEVGTLVVDSLVVVDSLAVVDILAEEGNLVEDILVGDILVLDKAVLVELHQDNLLEEQHTGLHQEQGKVCLDHGVYMQVVQKPYQNFTNSSDLI